MTEEAGTQAGAGPEPADTELAGGDQAGATTTPAEPSWRDSLGDDIKDHPTLNKFTTVEGLAKSYINAEQMIGRDKIVMPQTPEELTSVYQRLGTPETYDTYELPEIEGLQGNKDDQVEFKKFAHSLNLSQDQAAGLYGKIMTEFVNNQAQAINATKQQLKGAINKLKEEWGEAFPRNKQIAQRAVQQFGGEEMTNFLNKTGLGNHPLLVKTFAEIGLKTMEDGSLIGVGGAAGETPAEIKSQINDAMVDPAYTDPTHVNHKAIVEKVFNLRQRLHA